MKKKPVLPCSDSAERRNFVSSSRFFRIIFLKVLTEN